MMSVKQLFPYIKRMNKVIVSFCNTEIPLHQSSKILIDLDTGEQIHILSGIKGGTTGITIDDNYFYALNQWGSTFTIQDRKTFIIIKKEKFLNTFDPHSIAVDNDIIYSVSTGDDSIRWYVFDAEKNTIELKETYFELFTGKDTQHINCIDVYKGDVYFSAFGKSPTGDFADAINGYIYNVSIKEKVVEGIYHPHSLLIIDGNIYYIESALCNIKLLDKTIIDAGDYSCYLRGLAFTDDYIVAGSSKNRKSKDSSCSVLIFNKKTKEFVKDIKFTNHYIEVYDIINYPIDVDRTSLTIGTKNVTDVMKEYLSDYMKLLR